MSSTVVPSAGGSSTPTAPWYVRGLFASTRHGTDGLHQLDPQIAYLTGDHVPPGERGFEVLEEVSTSEKALRKAVAAYGCGTLEILVRGLDVDPDALRKRLRLKGSRSLSLVLTRIGRKGVGFLCEAGVRAV